MKTYARPAAAAAPLPSTRSAVASSPSPGRRSSHTTLTVVSAMSRPDAPMYAHAATSTAADGTKPVGSVVAGSARIPAPTVVPAMSAPAAKVAAPSGRAPSA